MTMIQELQAKDNVEFMDVMTDKQGLQAATRESGTVTIRTVLSALPETRRSDAGLKCKVVGGNSCAFKMVNNGWVR